jgi:hypothetical protein
LKSWPSKSGFTPVLRAKIWHLLAQAIAERGGTAIAQFMLRHSQTPESIGRRLNQRVADSPKVLEVSADLIF